MARLLHDRVAELARGDLPLRLVLDRLHQRPQRVQVLDLAARPELLGIPAGRTDTLASMRSEPSSIFTSETPIASSVAAQLFDVALRLLGRADVGLGDDLEQRHAGAVVVDERVLGVVDAAAAADVQRLAGVLFEVRARDADALAVDLELAVDR